MRLFKTRLTIANPAPSACAFDRTPFCHFHFCYRSMRRNGAGLHSFEESSP